MNRNERLNVLSKAEVSLGVCIDELLSMHRTYCPDCKGGCPTLRYVEAAEAAKRSLAKLWLELDAEMNPCPEAVQRVSAKGMPIARNPAN